MTMINTHTHLNKVTIAFTFASRIRTLNPNIVIIMVIAAGKYKSSIVRGCVCRAWLSVHVAVYIRRRVVWDTSTTEDCKVAATAPAVGTAVDLSQPTMFTLSINRTPRKRRKKTFHWGVGDHCRR